MVPGTLFLNFMSISAWLALSSPHILQDHPIWFGAPSFIIVFRSPWFHETYFHFRMYVIVSQTALLFLCSTYGNSSLLLIDLITVIDHFSSSCTTNWVTMEEKRTSQGQGKWLGPLTLYFAIDWHTKQFYCCSVILLGTHIRQKGYNSVRFNSTDFTYC